MKNKIITIVFLCLFMNNMISQTKKIVNPKGKWFFGAEIGTNTMLSYSPNSSLQGGISTEYYFHKRWSLYARIKYFKTGLSFYAPDTHSGSWFDLGSDEYSGNFNGAVISFPLNIKREFRIYRNFRGNFKLGFAYNTETKSEYLNYSDNQRTDYPKQYGNFNSGFGISYYLDKKTAIFLDFENYFGGERGRTPNLVSNGSKYLSNNLINFGIKYNFTK